MTLDYARNGIIYNSSSKATLIQTIGIDLL
jgi:hypothetical protein